MFGFGLGELALVVVIALLLFGPALFVRVAGSLGTGVNEFRRAVTDGEKAESGEPGSTDRPA